MRRKDLERPGAVPGAEEEGREVNLTENKNSRLSSNILIPVPNLQFRFRFLLKLIQVSLLLCPFVVGALFLLLVLPHLASDHRSHGDFPGE